MSTRSHAAIALLTFALALAAAAIPVLSHAASDHDGPFAASHPRREQVNERLANQNQRINRQLAEGHISVEQAARLHREDRLIRREERLMASLHGGHITRQEQRLLNRQENAVSRQIGR